MADNQLHKTHKLRNEENEREDDEAKERMTKNFADDVAIQDAHERKAECSMPRAHQPARCAR